jgi:hypothetical protein
VAVQAPTLRMTADKAPQTLPALQRAAQALSHIEAGAADPPPAAARKPK